MDTKKKPALHETILQKMEKVISEICQTSECWNNLFLDRRADLTDTALLARLRVLIERSLLFTDVLKESHIPKDKLMETKKRIALMIKKLKSAKKLTKLSDAVVLKNTATMLENCLNQISE